MYSLPAFELRLLAALSDPPGLPGSLAILWVHAASKHPGRQGTRLLFSSRADCRLPLSVGGSPPPLL